MAFNAGVPNALHWAVVLDGAPGSAVQDRVMAYCASEGVARLVAAMHLVFAGQRCSVENRNVFRQSESGG